MDLLEKASIILTPTAYNNGEALCVKPTDGSGDFDFSRNSAATRVNAQGLVENVQILSSNLVQNGDFSELGSEEVSNGSFSQEGVEEVTNGDFSNGTTGWSSNATLTESNNIANITTTSPSVVYIRQNNVYEFGKSYKLTFTAKVDNLTEFSLYVGSTNNYIDTGIIPTQTTDFEQYTFYFQTDTAGGMNLLLRQSMIANSSIEYSEISIVEVGQDWDTSIGDATIGDNVAIFPTSTNSFLIQVNVVDLSVKTYKLQYEVVTTNGSNFRLSGGNSAFGTVNLDSATIGVKTVYLTSNGTARNLQFNNNNFIGSITNISVKEVDPNDYWTLGTGWSIGDGVAISDATQGYINQNNLGGAGVTATYKVQWTQNITAGTRLRFFARNYNDGGNATIISITRDDGLVIGGGNCIGNGTFTAYVSSTNGYSFKLLAEAGVEGDISNVTTIQITDDTNLPRINYEGFSYQDALGSELVVNGGFDSDSNWYSDANWSIANGVATSTGSGRMFQSIPFLENNIGTKVKVSFDIVDYTSAGVVINCYGGVSSLFQGVGSYSFITTTTNSLNLYINNAGQGNLVGSIDNVSVKEYLGQEVVPDSGCGSWLFEPQSTNLVTDSQNYNSTYWGGQRGTLSDGGVGLFYLSPTSNVIKYEVTQSQYNQMYYRLPSAVTIGNTYTQQGYVKCDDAPYIHFQIQPLTGNPSIVWDNINNVVISSDPSIDSFNITSLNGWVKAEITYTATVASIYASLKTYFSTSSTSNWAGVTVGTIAYQTFVQVEQQSYATSYIPTNGEPNGVTRNQDVCTNGGSLASINSTEGVLYAEIAKQSEEEFKLISLNNAANNEDNNSVTIGFNNSENSKLYLRVKANDNNVLLSQNILSNKNQFYKIAIKYKSGEVSFFVDGVKVLSSTSSFSFSAQLDNLSFDFNGDGTLPFYGKTKALVVYKEALSDEELTELTTI